MKNYISIFFSLIFLLSFIGVTHASSFCEKETACQSCEHDSEECSASSQEGCCKVDVKLDKLSTDLNYTGERPEIASLLFFPSWIENLRFLNPQEKQDISYLQYSSPLSVWDIPILVQNFRI